MTMADRDPGKVSADVNWREVARLVLTSREMDRLEEEELVPAKKVLYQFSARAATTWRRCCSGCTSRMATRPAAIIARGRCCWRSACRSTTRLGSGMGRAGGYSDGRDIGVVFNYPNPGGAPALADVRRSRRAIHADRRLGAGDRL